MSDGGVTVDVVESFCGIRFPLTLHNDDRHR
jgi:hypothetical protein